MSWIDTIIHRFRNHASRAQEWAERRREADRHREIRNNLRFARLEWPINWDRSFLESRLPPETSGLWPLAIYCHCHAWPRQYRRAALLVARYGPLRPLPERLHQEADMVEKWLAEPEAGRIFPNEDIRHQVLSAFKSCRDTNDSDWSEKCNARGGLYSAVANWHEFRTGSVIRGLMAHINLAERTPETTFDERAKWLQPVIPTLLRQWPDDPPRTADAVGIAEAMYESDDWSRGPILADALQDGGWPEAAVTRAGLRDPSVPLNPCSWVVRSLVSGGYNGFSGHTHSAR